MISESRGARSRAVKVSAKYLAVGLTCIFFGFPIFWMAFTSIKPLELISRSPPVWLFTPTIEHYRQIFVEKGLFHSLYNSFVVAGASTVLALLVGAPAAYAFARFRFRGKESLAFFFLSARM